MSRWHEAPLLPGVQRLISHLQANKVPLALATSTPRATLVRKLSAKSQVHEAFASTCCGDEVRGGRGHSDWNHGPGSVRLATWLKDESETHTDHPFLPGVYRAGVTLRKEPS